MRAAQIVSLDGPKAVRTAEVPEPEPNGDQVIVEVHAAGVCYPDALLTRGLYQYKPDPPFVPGSEVAGFVKSAPEGSGLREGQRVAAFPAFGGFAEYVAVQRQLVLPLPDGIELVE